MACSITKLRISLVSYTRLTYIKQNNARIMPAGAATVLNFFLNALVLCFYLEHVQRITFYRCFLIFNQAVFCVDDGVVLRLKI